MKMSHNFVMYSCFPNKKPEQRSKIINVNSGGDTIFSNEGIPALDHMHASDIDQPEIWKNTFFVHKSHGDQLR